MYVTLCMGVCHFILGSPSIWEYKFPRYCLPIPWISLEYIEISILSVSSYPTLEHFFWLVYLGVYHLITFQRTNSLIGSIYSIFSIYCSFNLHSLFLSWLLLTLYLDCLRVFIVLVFIALWCASLDNLFELYLNSLAINLHRLPLAEVYMFW